MRRNKQSKYLSFKLQSRQKLRQLLNLQTAMPMHAFMTHGSAKRCAQARSQWISVEAIDNLDDLGVESCGRNGCASSWTFDHQRLRHVPLVRSSVGE